MPHVVTTTIGVLPVDRRTTRRTRCGGAVVRWLLKHGDGTPSVDSADPQKHHPARLSGFENVPECVHRVGIELDVAVHDSPPMSV